jgi:luciferase family oxidoreductase group 1
VIDLSVLDLSLVSVGDTSSGALAATTELARRADALGYRRFWVAEHHNMALVASTAPAVLIAHLAASTATIRVGSGGVMLPNHPPLVVAEQFAMLEALHPGRIDLGIGRAPGTDPATAAALRRSAELHEGEQGEPSKRHGAEDFPHDLLEVMGLLGDERVEHHQLPRFRATPAAVTYPEILLLGSSGYSAQLAGQLGLGFAFAHHFDLPGVVEAVTWYRERFRPSPALERPHTIVTAGVMAAETADEAEHLAGPARLAVMAIRTGRPAALLTPDEAAAHPDLPIARQMPSNRIVGDPAHVVAELRALAERTGADELMLSTMAHGLDTRVHTLELVRAAW